MDFNGILIGTGDAPRLVAYYTKILGEPGFSDSGYTGWRIGSGYITVGPHSDVTGNNPEPGRFIWNIETTDLAGEFERFKASGAIVVREPYAMDDGPEVQIATFADPDGNYFQLLTPMQM